MKREIKLIALDLDGTLLTTEKKLTDYTRNVLAKAIEQGCEVVVSSGRPISAIPKELLEFPGMRYVVSANGARIVDLKEKKTLYENLIPVETAAKVLDVLAGYDDIYEIFVDGIGYTKAEGMTRLAEYFSNPAMREYMLETRIPVEDVKAELYKHNKPLDKIQGIFLSREAKKPAAKQLAEIPGLEVTGAFGFNHEINVAGTSKGVALKVLGELIGIDTEEMMACGDGMNDYDMLQTVGLAVGMANGHPEVKEMADYVTETNDENGVAKAIERFVLK